MEYLPPYIQLGEWEIHWINTILAGSFILYFILWITMLTGFKKKPDSFIEYIFRIILIIPFWLLFSLNFLESIYPNSYTYLNDEIKKEIELVNNTDSKADFSFYSKNKTTNEWELRYESSEFFSMDNYSLEAGEKGTAEILIDTSKYSSVLLRYYEDGSNLNYGVKLKSNEVPSRLYVEELRDEILLDVEMNYTYQYYKILIFAFGIIFLWYHYGMYLRRVHRRRFLILGGLLTLYSLLSIGFYLRSIFFKELFGI